MENNNLKNHILGMIICKNLRPKIKKQERDFNGLEIENLKDRIWKENKRNSLEGQVRLSFKDSIDKGDKKNEE